MTKPISTQPPVLSVCMVESIVSPLVLDERESADRIRELAESHEQLRARLALAERAREEADDRTYQTMEQASAAIGRAEKAEQERDAAQKAMAYSSEQAHLEWTRAEAAEAQRDEIKRDYDRHVEYCEHRKGRRMSLLECISDGPLDPLPFLADEIKTLTALRDSSPPEDRDPKSGASQRRFWLDQSIMRCQEIERHVARLNIEAEEMRAQLAALMTALEGLRRDVEEAMKEAMAEGDKAKRRNQPTLESEYQRGSANADYWFMNRLAAALSAIPTEAK